jgi:hypothetical protein
MKSTLLFFLLGIHSFYCSDDTPDIQAGIVEAFYFSEEAQAKSILHYIESLPHMLELQEKVTLAKSSDRIELRSKTLALALDSEKEKIATIEPSRLSDDDAFAYVLGSFLRGGISTTPYTFSFINDEAKAEFLQTILKRFRCQEVEIELANPGRKPKFYNLTIGGGCLEFQQKLDLALKKIKTLQTNNLPNQDLRPH